MRACVRACVCVCVCVNSVLFQFTESPPPPPPPPPHTHKGRNRQQHLLVSSQPIRVKAACSLVMTVKHLDDLPLLECFAKGDGVAERLVIILIWHYTQLKKIKNKINDVHHKK